MMPGFLNPVVATGAGVLACNGIGREAFWRALREGKSGINTVDRFDVEPYPCKIAGQLWDFDPNDFLVRSDVKRWHRATHQALAAAQLAVDDAGLTTAGYEPERIAVGVGTSVGSLDEMYEEHKRTFEEKGWNKMDKLASSATSGHASTANVSARFGFRGPAITIASGCATGLDMLAWGRRQIQSGLADAAVIGATEAPLNPLLFGGTCKLGIMSQCNDAPAEAMRPFDKSSDGLVLAEAAVVLVLERADRAVARGSRILGEVAGTGGSSEGHNPVILEKDGTALARAMLLAMRDAGMTAADVDCAHCHGVSLPMYDRCETQAYKKALGAHAYRVPISATKSMIGQAYSVGGLLSVVGALMSLSTGVMPPTLNLKDPDPACDLDFVPMIARMNDVRSAMVTALSFGGTHAAAVLRRLN